MMLPEFKVLTVKNKEEAVAALSSLGGAKVVAGGTDLLVKMQKGESWDLLVDVSGASEMKRIHRDGSAIHIGSGVTHRRISDDNTLKDAAASLAYACSQVGSPQIRNMGTIGGNLVNASPAADSLPPLLIHDAVITLESAVSFGSLRTVNLDDFIVSPYKTTIRDNELLTQIQHEEFRGLQGRLQTCGKAIYLGDIETFHCMGCSRRQGKVSGCEACYWLLHTDALQGACG